MSKRHCNRYRASRRACFGRYLSSWIILIALGLCTPPLAAQSSPLDSSEVLEIFTNRCGACHNDSDLEGKFSVSSFESLLAGTPDGPVVVAGSPSGSKLFRLISGQAEPAMPPEGEAPLTKEEIKRIERWINEGAKTAPSMIPLDKRLKVKPIPSLFEGPTPITAIALDERSSKLAIGRHGRIDWVKLQDAVTDRNKSGTPVETFQGIIGKVSQLRMSKDKRWLAAASGISGLGGQITILDANTNKLVAQWESNRDILAAAALSPDSRFIAAGGYDRVVHLYDVENHRRLKSFEGHNGAIYDLEFDPTGSILATASGDETVKIWSVETGERLDTLGQGEGEQYSVRFSPDGKWVAAAGADKRIRTWKIASLKEAVINPLVQSAFAHEGSVLAIAFAPNGKWLASVGEDRTVKWWTVPDLQLLGELGQVDEVPSAVEVASDGMSLWVATLGGTTKRFEIPPTNPLRVLENGSIAEKGLSLPSPDPRWSVVVSAVEEVEGNDTFARAQWVQAPAKISGKISVAAGQTENTASTNGVATNVVTTNIVSTNKFASSHSAESLSDEDWYAFDAADGEEWVVSVSAARSGSPLDSRIEICDEAGHPVLRTRLQAVRESYFTFRGKSSDVVDDFRLHGWQEMELNEWLYAGGEVVRLWLYPRGPDSGFKVYPGYGSRYTFFDTTPASHALGEPAWIVKELRAGETPSPNGLPVFPIYFENDDDSQRRFGKDSKVLFRAPKAGRYLVRVRDARSQSGDKYVYTLGIEAPRPSFSIAANAESLSMSPGTGREFELTTVRDDGFLDPIEIRFEGLPPGIIATQPLFIEAWQDKALATIFWPSNSDQEIPAEFDFRVIAKAKIAGEWVEKSFEKMIHVKKGEAERVRFKVFPSGSDQEASSAVPLVIHPGETISAKVIAERGAFQGDIGFGTDDCGRNLPHGIIVGNIGLSGLLIPAGQTQQELFLIASPWIPVQERLFHLRANIDGNPTTLPILLKVEK